MTSNILGPPPGPILCDPGAAGCAFPGADRHRTAGEADWYIGGLASGSTNGLSAVELAGTRARDHRMEIARLTSPLPPGCLIEVP